MVIIPTVFEKDFLKAEERIVQVKDTTTWIQIDVSDGFYCQGKTFELELLTKIENLNNNLLAIHLMVKNPIKWVNKCMFAGAARVTGQIELMEDTDKFVEAVKNEGMEAGLAYDINTVISKDVPSEIDEVLLMSRKAGFGNYEFNNEVFKKIKLVNEFRLKNNLNFSIGVDGGIDINKLKRLKNCGVDMVYSGDKYFQMINAI